MTLRILVGCKRAIDYAVKVGHFFAYDFLIVVNCYLYFKLLDSSEIGLFGRRHRRCQARSKSI
jgi:hypothetical protein